MAPGRAGGAPTGPHAADDDDTASARGARRVSIQVKLLVLLLLVGLLAAVVVGFLGYRSGRTSLQESAEQRLVELRQSRSRELDQYFGQVRASLDLDTRGSATIEAVTAFSAGFDALDRARPRPADAAAVRRFYADRFAPAYERAAGSAPPTAELLPDRPAQQRLQALYTAPSDDPAQRLARDRAGDDSAWTRAHARHHSHFRQLMAGSGYEDVLLLDLRGDVVYTATKGVDLGTNVETGPYRGGALQRVFEQARSAPELGAVGITDYERYGPALDQPTSFAASPIGTPGHYVGVQVVRLSRDRLNAVMTGDRTWAQSGLGRTGEIFLVGPDRLMRSTARGLVEDPQGYRAEVVAAGTPPEVADRELAVRDSVLLQPVAMTAVDRALRGESGIVVGRGYLGHETLTAYAPVDLPGVQWVVLAKLQTAEAFAPVTTFARTLWWSTLGLVLLLSLVALRLAQLITRPIRALVGAADQVAAGDLGARVPVARRDEIGELGSAFNRMAASLSSAARENDRLHALSESRQRWLQASAEVSNALLSPEDDREPLQEIVDHVRRLADADLVSLVVPDGEGLLRVVAVSGEGADELGGIRYSAPGTLAARAMDTGEGLRLGTMDELRGHTVHLSRVLDVGAVLAVPLSGPAGAQGAIVAGRRVGRPPFTAEDLELGDAFARHAAVARELFQGRSDQERLALLEDRERIARDLHDHVIQRLFAAGLTLQSLHVRSDPLLSARLSGLVTEFDGIIRELRASIFRLQTGPPPAGLQRRVLTLVRRATPTLGFEPSLRFEGPLDAVVPDELATEIEAVVQESLSNVAQHAAASDATVRLSAVDGAVSVDVADNGVGPGAVPPGGGLADLRRRAEALGGTLTVAEEAPHGTRVRWHVPAAVG